MGFVAITMLCLLLSNLQTQRMQSQPFHHRQEKAVAELQHLLDLELPRKLKISDQLPWQAKENANEASSSEDDDSPGKEEQINKMHGNNGGEWDEDDPLVHFTMDYTSIKRRRPIHNMSAQHP